MLTDIVMWRVRHGLLLFILAVASFLLLKETIPSKLHFLRVPVLLYQLFSRQQLLCLAPPSSHYLGHLSHLVLLLLPHHLKFSGIKLAFGEGSAPSGLFHFSSPLKLPELKVGDEEKEDDEEDDKPEPSLANESPIFNIGVLFGEKLRRAISPRRRRLAHVVPLLEGSSVA